MTTSVTLLQSRVQTVAQSSRCDDRHCDAHNDPALGSLAAEIWHRHPAHNPHDMLIGLDSYTRDVETRHLNVLNEGEFTSVVLHHHSSSDIAVVTSRKPRSPEHCAKLSTALKGRRPSDACFAAAAEKRAREGVPGLKGRRPSEACLKAAAEAKRRRFSESALARMADGRRRGAKTPKWVPKELIPEFKQVLAETRCEFAACRHVRGLLAEMRAP